MEKQDREAAGFLFDCDGTLLDSMGCWRATEDMLADEAGIALSPAQIEKLCAFTIPELAAFFHRQYGLGTDVDAVLGMVDDVMLDFYACQVQAKPGALSLVRALHNRGIVCGVTSSSPQRYLQAGLEHCGFRDCFAAVLSVDDVGASKREPRIYRTALDQMRVRAWDAWGVDDALYALESMARLGIRTLGVYDRDEAATFEELAAFADIAVLSLRQVHARDFVSLAVGK